MIDWDDAFDNSGYVPGADAFRDHWAASAAELRSTWGYEEIAYGQHSRERADVFKPKSKEIGTVIFVHGGYWHMLDKSFVSHFAAGPLARGWRVIVPSYPLCPELRVSQIVESLQRLIEPIKGEIALIGHSAGGHLVSRLATLTPVSRVVSVSGVHDLRPLLATRMNETLRLTADEALAESPALLPAPKVPITFWVGAAERPEFLRQCRLAAEAWPDARDVYEPGLHHFNIVDSLCDPDGALTREVCGDAS